MLLQHAWLAPLDKPETITEEDEEAAEAAAEAEANGEAPPMEPQPIENQGNFIDREVGEWVIAAIDRRKKGTLGKSAKPALHAAPLDAVGSPQAEKPTQGAVAV